MKSTYMLIATVLIIAACKSGADPISANSENEENPTKSSVIKPIAGLEILPSIYQVIADKESKVQLPNGGSIEIPAEAFVHLDGSPVKGKVDLEWTEFHSLTDIMLSGIPMKYDSAGVQHNFVSGGMFTIKAKQKGEEIEIAPNKELMVNLVSTDDTPCYNFYTLNEETGKWNYETTKTGTPINQKNEVPAPVKKADPLLIDCEVEFSQFQELNGKDIIAWKVTEELNLDQKKRIKNNISILTLQKDDEGYFLDFKRKNLSSTVRVEPYLLSEAQGKSAVLKKEMKEDFAAVKTYYQDIASGRIMRSVGISRFGTCNWDVIFRTNDVQFVYANFEYGPDAKNTELACLYYMCPEANVVAQANPLEENQFFYLPKYKNGLIAIMPNNEVYVLKSGGFKEIASQRGRANYTFRLQPTGIIAKKGNEIAELAKELF